MNQLSTIDLLTAMFPSPGELEIPPSTAQYIEELRSCQEGNTSPAGVPSSITLAVQLPIIDTKSIRVNLCIQPHQHEDDVPPPIEYSLRQPDWMTKAEVSNLAALMPRDDLFAALEYIKDQALQHLEIRSKQQEPQVPNHLQQSVVRVWFYFPSLSTRGKRDDLVNHASEYDLTGFVLAGKPGVLCLEGRSRDIDAYMGFIKTYSWGDIPSHQKKVSERFRQTDIQRVFVRMEEITDMFERSGQRFNRGATQALEAWLRERGLHEGFKVVLS